MQYKFVKGAQRQSRRGLGLELSNRWVNSSVGGGCDADVWEGRPGVVWRGVDVACSIRRLGSANWLNVVSVRELAEGTVTAAC